MEDTPYYVVTQWRFDSTILYPYRAVYIAQDAEAAVRLLETVVASTEPGQLNRNVTIERSDLDIPLLNLDAWTQHYGRESGAV